MQGKIANYQGDVLVYLFWVIWAISLLAGLSFYFRMRKVGRLLGGRFRSSMNVALTLLVIIPFFLSLIPDISNEGLSLVTGISAALSWAAGAILLPSVLLEALGQQSGDKRNSVLVEAVAQDSFEVKVQAIRERQRAKREAGGER